MIFAWFLLTAGGYHLDSLAASVVASLEGLSQSEVEPSRDGGEDALQPEPLEKVDDLIQRVRVLHSL